MLFKIKNLVTSSSMQDHHAPKSMPQSESRSPRYCESYIILSKRIAHLVELQPALMQKPKCFSIVQIDHVSCIPAWSIRHDVRVRPTKGKQQTCGHSAYDEKEWLSEIGYQRTKTKSVEEHPGMYIRRACVFSAAESFALAEQKAVLEEYKHLSCSAAFIIKVLLSKAKSYHGTRPY